MVVSYSGVNEFIVTFKFTWSTFSVRSTSSAVNTVAGFLKEKLPAPLAGQVDNVLSGAGGMTDKLGDVAGKVGGIFGGS